MGIGASGVVVVIKLIIVYHPDGMSWLMMKPHIITKPRA
jgi:hypothetical protein